MKKNTWIIVYSSLILLIGAINVNAANSWTYSNHSVTSGGAKSYVNLSATNNYASLDMTIQGVTSGSSTTTVFKGYKTTNTSTTLKTTKSFTVTKYTSLIKSLGYIGSGTWQITNNAFSGSTDYAGWNGILVIKSVTSG